MNSHGNIHKWLSSFWYFVRLIMYALAGIKFQMMFLLCMMNPTVLLTWTSRGSNESGHILKRRINETLVLCQILSSLKLQKGTTIKTFQISVANCHFFISWNGWSCSFLPKWAKMAHFEWIKKCTKIFSKGGNKLKASTQLHNLALISNETDVSNLEKCQSELDAHLQSCQNKIFRTTSSDSARQL